MVGAGLLLALVLFIFRKLMQSHNAQIETYMKIC